MPAASVSASEELDRVASVVERIAELLSAGVAPTAAWRYLSEMPSPFRDHVAGVAARIDRGQRPVEAILECARGTPHAAPSPVPRARPQRKGDPAKVDSAAWRGFAAAWMVATDAGAPLAPSLRDFSHSLRALANARRASATALAGPIATAKLVMVLPPLGMLFGAALGFDTIGTLFTTTPGLVCLGVGGVLLLAASAWNGRLVRRAMPTNLTPGLVFDLLAIAVSGGASIERARIATKDVLRECGLGPEPDGANHAGIDDADEILTLSHRAGVPAGLLLRSEALRVRREAAHAAERNAAQLGATLMLPLGVCVLPAFMVLGVAPLMMSVFSSTMGGLS